MRALFLAIVWAGSLGFVGSATAENLEACDFNKVAGKCSVDISVDPETHEIRIPASGQCRKVDVLVDGTVYAFSLKDREVVETPMVFDKTKEVSISVAGCTTFMTYDEVMAMCRPTAEAAVAPCRAQREALNAECVAKGNPPGCWTVTQDATEGCYSNAADAANRCVGERVYELRRTTNFIGIGPAGQ